MAHWRIISKRTKCLFKGSDVLFLQFIAKAIFLNWTIHKKFFPVEVTCMKHVCVCVILHMCKGVGVWVWMNGCVCGWMGVCAGECVCLSNFSTICLSSLSLSCWWSSSVIFSKKNSCPNNFETLFNYGRERSYFGLKNICSLLSLWRSNQIYFAPRGVTFKLIKVLGMWLNNNPWRCGWVNLKPTANPGLTRQHS